jgi:hypothetical protein
MSARAGGAHGWHCVSPLYRCTGVYQAKLVRASWVCAILGEGGLWNHLWGITTRKTSVTL